MHIANFDHELGVIVWYTDDNVYFTFGSVGCMHSERTLRMLLMFTFHLSLRYTVYLAKVFLVLISPIIFALCDSVNGRVVQL